MPKKRKFIDKKKAITFHLVHRSQHDPLAADEKAPQRVLASVAFDKNGKGKKKEELLKYGIYFDDDYNYLQHLRDVNKADVVWVETPKINNNEKHKLNLPSSVFASRVEEKIGLLNKAAPESGLRLDLDPDIVASMDEDFDYSNPDNILEDNFVSLANAPLSGNEEFFDERNNNKRDYFGEDSLHYSDYSNEMADKIENLMGFDTTSRFTDYSMTSSVISRNSQLTLLDETFEQMYSNYEEAEIGALDCDEIEGEIDINSQLFKSAVDEFEKEHKTEKLTIQDIEKVMVPSSSDTDEENGYLKYEVKEREKWDCESILSTYSNIYNHPVLIKEPINKIQIDKKTGIPVVTVKLTEKALSHLDDSVNRKGPSSIISTMSMLSMRDKKESPEEKKERKRQLKAYRQIRRMERKANTTAFKEEKKKLERTMAQNKLNRQGFVL